MLQVPEHLVHLIHVSLGIVVLDSQLIAVGLADGAILVRPGIPDASPQIMDVVAFGLPDPEQLIDGGLPVSPPQRQDREFFREIVAVHNPELLDGMGGSPIFPARANLAVGVPNAVVENITTVLNKDFVCSAHGLPPCIAGCQRCSILHGVLWQSLRVPTQFHK